MRIIFARQARQDLAEAKAFLRRRSRAVANQLSTDITTALERLASGLVEGPEGRLRDGRLVHSWSVPPYRIYYRRRRQTLEVVRIHHSARRPIEDN